MIAYFPTVYPDELVYSWLSRFYLQSGYLNYISAAEDIYINKRNRPDYEFLNPLQTEIYSIMTGNISMDEIIEKHTMFPYYGRFIKKDRRIKAYESIKMMQGNYKNFLVMPASGEVRYLRYCPECAICDRGRYGEAYWHRSHQIWDIQICPEHKCRLINSNILMSGKSTPNLTAADCIIGDNKECYSTISYSDNMMECRLAEYVFNIFHGGLDIDSDIQVGAFLHSKTADSKYRSVRGQQRNISLLHADIMDFYSDISAHRIDEVWKIQKVLSGDRTNCYEICMIAMFLNVSEEELLDMKIPIKAQEQQFDERVIQLHEQGLSYPQIAKELNASYEVVKSIGRGAYGKYHKTKENPKKGGAKKYNWNKIDLETLPLVKDAIDALLYGKDGRPGKISAYSIQRYLNLPSKRIETYLPLCMAEIEKYHESQEQFWAREVVWAVNKIKDNGDILNWKHIRDLTNIRRCDFIVCMPYLKEFTGEQEVEEIENL